MREPGPPEREILDRLTGPQHYACGDSGSTAPRYYSRDEGEHIRNMVALGWIEYIDCPNGHKHRHARITSAGMTARYLQDVASGKTGI